ncbi:MAG TPA: hypothetical protein VHV75_14930 [Solirubrobacteraceae bacterium]|jgi:hypothetical protein|nr:hypothetical protein [Solirubrobacteraceae bacterium]
MSVRKRRSALISALVGIAAALFAQGALASVTPSLSLDQSAGTQAGATQNLGMDLQFQPAGTYPYTDTPDAMTINLPPGLLANAAINGGACLTTTDLTDTNCQVGTGVVTAYAAGLVPLPTDVTFDLVPPPAAGDLAGLAVNDDGTQIGSTADIRVRPSGDPEGVGISIEFILPNSLDGAPIDISEIDSTFDGLRYPTSCPSTPANVSVSVDSYSDSTVHTVTSPLSVTGCSKLPYAPKLSVKAVKDGADRQVAITTGVTQAADESPSKSLTLAFPGNTLGVNLSAIKLLCLNIANGCTPVGTATAVSPFYPKPLTANAYLTGTALGPSLTLVFPPPFPLTLVGSVTLTTKTASFTGLPDIPLTSLSLALNGGADGMFLTNCNPGNGTATGTSSDQNGDKTVSASVPYEISGCAASSYTSGSGTSSTDVAPTVSTPVASGIKTKHPSIKFRVKSAKKGAKVKQLTVELPHGLSFATHRTGKRTEIKGVKLSGAKVKSLTLSRGHLIIKLARPASSIGVTLAGSALNESAALIAKAKAGKAGRMRLTVISLDAKNKRHTIAKAIAL